MNLVPAHKYLTKEECKMLLEKNDYKALIEISLHWIWIIFAFLLVYFWTHPFTIIISLFILGGKQLACAILMHDASHKAVLSDSKLNDIVGQYLGAYPIMQNLKNYRGYHMSHHLNTGLDDDPDLLLTRGYPTTRNSMIRKFLRDLTAITGIKVFVAFMMMNLGFLEYSLGGEVVKVSQKGRPMRDYFRSIYKNLAGPIIANLIMFGVLYLLGNAWLYLLWVVAYFTTFQFVLRVRSMAEHSVVEDSKDPYKNTRTTYANFIEKMLFAPYHVNYHAEHHMLMGIPSYNLPKMHQLLKEKGYYQKGVLEENYWNVIKLAMKTS